MFHRVQNAKAFPCGKALTNMERCSNRAYAMFPVGCKYIKSLREECVVVESPPYCHHAKIQNIRMSEPRARSSSLKERLDGFLSDWRRTRSKSKMEADQQADPGMVSTTSSVVTETVIVDAAAVVLGGVGGGLSTSSEISHCDESVDAPRSVTNPSPTTEDPHHLDGDTKRMQQEHQEAEDDDDIVPHPSPRPTPPPPTLPRTTPPPSLMREAVDAVADGGRSVAAPAAPPQPLQPQRTETDLLEHVALAAVVPPKKAPAGSAREGSLKLSFTEALGQLARKHGVYYAEGSIRTRSSSSSLLDATTTTSTSSILERQRAIREEIQRWRAPQHANAVTLLSSSHHENTLLSLAAASHRSATPRGVTSARLSSLDVVRWPLLTQLNQLYVDCIASRIAGIEASSASVTPLPPLVEAEAAPEEAEAFPNGSGALAASPRCKPPPDSIDERGHAASSAAAAVTAATSTSSATKMCTLAQAAVATSAAAQHRTHMKHRLLDFFQSYDPQRLPTPEQMERVLACGVPEHLLFAFLQLRYGLSTGSALFGASFFDVAVSGGGGAAAAIANATTNVAVAQVVDAAGATAADEDGMSSPLGQRVVAAALAVDEASPDFYMDSHGGLGSSLSRREDIVVDTASWPPDWLDAVLPLVPTSAEIVMDAASWNTQSSKPGLANPKTTFVPAAQRSQLFTFNGLTMELVHDAMEATVLGSDGDAVPPPSLDVDAPAVLSQSHGGTSGWLMACDTQRRANAAELINVGDIVMFPWPQSLVWSEHRRQYGEQNGGSDAAMSMATATAPDGAVPPSSSTTAVGPQQTKRCAAHVGNPVLELDARLRATVPALADQPSLDDRAARRRRTLQAPLLAAADGAAQQLTQSMASALLSSSLSWKKGGGDVSSDKSKHDGPSGGGGGSAAHPLQQHHHHGHSSAVKAHHHHGGHRHGRVMRHDITPPPQHATDDGGVCDGDVADAVLMASEQFPSLLFVEDYWDLDDVDVRLAQSPIEFI